MCSNQFHVLYTCNITTATGLQPNCSKLLLLLFKKWKYYCRHLPPEWVCFKVVVTWTCCCEWV